VLRDYDRGCGALSTGCGRDQGEVSDHARVAAGTDPVRVYVALVIYASLYPLEGWRDHGCPCSPICPRRGRALSPGSSHGENHPRATSRTAFSASLRCIAGAGGLRWALRRSAASRCRSFSRRAKHLPGSRRGGPRRAVQRRRAAALGCARRLCLVQHSLGGRAAQAPAPPRYAGREWMSASR